MRTELAAPGFKLITRSFELVTRGFELVTRGAELVTRVLLFYSFLNKKNVKYENVIKHFENTSQKGCFVHKSFDKSHIKQALIKIKNTTKYHF